MICSGRDRNRRVLGEAAVGEMSGEVECRVCHAKVQVPMAAAAVSKAYDIHRSSVSSRQRALNVLLVSGDCVLAGLQVDNASPPPLPALGFGGLISVPGPESPPGVARGLNWFWWIA